METEKQQVLLNQRLKLLRKINLVWSRRLEAKKNNKIKKKIEINVKENNKIYFESKG